MTEERIVCERLSNRYPVEEIQEALESMEEENLLLHIGDEYLTLPVDRAARKGEK